MNDRGRPKKAEGEQSPSRELKIFITRKEIRDIAREEDKTSSAKQSLSRDAKDAGKDVYPLSAGFFKRLQQLKYQSKSTSKSPSKSPPKSPVKSRAPEWKKTRSTQTPALTRQEFITSHADPELLKQSQKAKSLSPVKEKRGALRSKWNTIVATHVTQRLKSDIRKAEASRPSFAVVRAPYLPSDIVPDKPTRKAANYEIRIKNDSSTSKCPLGDLNVPAVEESGVKPSRGLEEGVSLTVYVRRRYKHSTEQRISIIVEPSRGMAHRGPTPECNRKSRYENEGALSPGQEQEMKDPEVPADVNQSDLSDRLPKFPSNLNLPKWSLTASSEISL